VGQLPGNEAVAGGWIQEGDEPGVAVDEAVVEGRARNPAAAMIAPVQPSRFAASTAPSSNLRSCVSRRPRTSPSTTSASDRLTIRVSTLASAINWFANGSQMVYPLRETPDPVVELLAP
jgi:hypothetical protein